MKFSRSDQTKLAQWLAESTAYVIDEIKISAIVALSEKSFWKMKKELRVQHQSTQPILEIVI